MTQQCDHTGSYYAATLNDTQNFAALTGDRRITMKQ
jgi:hypothetical protein